MNKSDKLLEEARECVCRLDFIKACKKYEQHSTELMKDVKENYDLPLQNLTPLGSEYANNPKRCFDYIREKIRNRLALKKENILLKREIVDLKSALKKLEVSDGN